MGTPFGSRRGGDINRSGNHTGSTHSVHEGTESPGARRFAHPKDRRFFCWPRLLAAAATGAVAQTTGAIPPAGRTGAPSWSGQSGSSGDPRMSAAAIRADAARFQACLERLWPAAARRGVSRAVFDKVRAG